MAASLVGLIKKYKSYIFLALIILLTLKVIVPQLDGLKDSLNALKSANNYWILAGTIVYFAGIPVFAFQIMTLALRPLSFGMTLKVEMAGQFVSKLLPSFVGIFSLNMYYLIKKAHTATQAATVMTANALASSIAYTLLILIALIADHGALEPDSLKGSINIPTNLIYLIIILLIGSSYLIYKSVNFRSRLKQFLSDIKTNIKAYKDKPLAMLISVMCNLLGSSANIFALYASAHSIGVSISFATALLAYTFCNIAMTLVPTPGGLGAAEAGIYSGLVLAGVDGPDAITITLLYRLISFWLPILPGYYFFWGLRKNLLSGFSFKSRYGV